jgi:hypothetical protein
MAKSKTPSKKKGTKAPAKKKPVKKVAVKKKAAPKKAASTRKTAARVAKKTIPKKTIRRKAVETATKQKTKKKENKAVVEKIQTPPPVEEKSPEVNTTPSAFVPGLDKKSMEQAAVRNYDNHHIRLSNRKGGVKPSGKKPLWSR